MRENSPVAPTQSCSAASAHSFAGLAAILPGAVGAGFGPTSRRLQHQRPDDSRQLRDRRLLWIDDEVGDDFATIRLLELEIGDLAIECALSGGEGLRMALSSVYDGVVLDLRLPDVAGLKVLDQLKAAGITTPVLVVSGWADAESTVAAIKAGAMNVRSKPLIGDDLISAVRELLASDRSMRSLPSRTALRAPVAAATTAPAQLPATSGRQPRVAIERTAGLLVHPMTSPLEFVAMARSFRAVVLRGHAHADVGKGAVHHLDALAIGRHVPAQDYTSTRFDEFATAQRVATAIGSAIAEGRLPSEEDIAVQLRVPAAEIHRVLKITTEAGFRETRRALRIRPAVRDVAYSFEQIAQIAYRCHYSHPGQFDRDFVRTLGIAPRRFRRLFEPAPWNQPNC